MSSRRTSRQVALQVLYSIDASGDPVEEAFERFCRSFSPNDQCLPFARSLVEGVMAQRGEIDALLESASDNWRLTRMGRVDRNILRLGIFEMLHLAEVPDKVAINEAVELAKTFGADESPAFVNGVLDAIRQKVRDAGP